MKIGRRGFLVASAAGWATLKAKFLASRALPVVSSRETASNRLSGFKMVATGSWVRLGDAPQGYDSAFACGLQGWNIVNGGSPASYHFAVQPSGDFGVAIGFYDPITKPGRRVQNVVIDGDLVDTIDPAAEGKPVTVSPREIERFALNVRIPGWSSFREIEINGEASALRPQSGYARIERSWKIGDRVDVRFDLPLRVVLDSGYGPTPIQTGPVSIDGADPVGARSILIYRGPVILAQFRLQNGCDLVWTYTGDDPYLLETIKTVPDKFVIGRSEFRHESTPELTHLAKKPEGILIQWEWETGPDAAWVVKRSAWIRATLPVQIEYGAEIIPPPSPDSKDVENVLDTGRFCGVRMQWPTTEPSTYFEKRGYPKRPTVSVDSREPVQQAYDGLRGNRIVLDSGSVRYQVSSKSRSLIANEDRSGAYSGIYCLPRKKQDGHLLASCMLAITGQSQFQMPLISPHAGVA